MGGPQKPTQQNIYNVKNIIRKPGNGGRRGGGQIKKREKNIQNTEKTQNAHKKHRKNKEKQVRIRKVMSFFLSPI